MASFSTWQIEDKIARGGSLLSVSSVPSRAVLNVVERERERETEFSLLYSLFLSLVRFFLSF